MNTKPEIDNNLFAPSNLPTNRAAYSDRTALLMARISKISYTKFDTETDPTLEEKLKKIGLELVGSPISRGSTQAIVTVQKEKNKIKFAVICFRGTEFFKMEDWRTNFKAEPVPIKDPKNKEKNIGYMHLGYHKAYQPIEGTVNGVKDINAVNGPVEDSVAHDIDLILKEHVDDNVPIYITGHSMGGAIAMVATWYMKMPRLAACYTFGAPKIGDDGPLGWFRTPIYRVVNGRDPIPDFPPSNTNVGFWKSLTYKFKSKVLCSDKTVPEKGFTHYGVKKYIPTYSNNDKLRVLPYASYCHVIHRFLTTPLTKSKQFLGYHAISEYQKKLEIIAKNRNP